jgi:15-cis-phytoene synthase
VIEAAREPFAAATAASPARYFAALYAPPAHADYVAHLLALEYEMSAATRPGVDHAVAHARLEWWQGEAARTAAGAPVHPLTRAIQSEHAAAGMPPLDVRPWAETLAWDLAGAPLASGSELQKYVSAWRSAVFAPLGQRLRVASETGTLDIALIGDAVRELELLGLLTSDPELGARRIPSDELHKAGLPLDAFDTALPGAPASAWLSSRYAATHNRLSAAVTALPKDQQPALRPLLVWVALSTRIARRRVGTLAQQAAPSARRALGDTFSAWRAALAADRGKYQLATV